MAKRRDILDFEIYIGDTPIEKLKPEERENFSRNAVKRMGNALNSYFSQHIDEYQTVKGEAPRKGKTAI